jgi:cAMP-dependent protein kinase regulator
VYAYKRGEYFGEIALLNNLPREASVKTVTDTRLYFINADCFSRILCPL